MEHFKSMVTDKIPPGTKFVALYGDGSGASLFLMCGGMELINWRHDVMYLHGDNGSQEWLFDSGYCHWIEIPDTFKFWGECSDGGGE